MSIFRAADVSITDEAAVVFKSYQKPPLVRRGKCVGCQSSTHEKVSIPGLPKLIIVATELLPPALKTRPLMHMFYHRRVKDVSDNVPRLNGFVKSQSAFMFELLRSLWRSRRAAK